MFWHRKCVLMLNWVVWNRTVYMCKNESHFNNLQWLMCHKNRTKLSSINQVPELTVSAVHHMIDICMLEHWWNYNELELK